MVDRCVISELFRVYVFRYSTGTIFAEITVLQQQIQDLFNARQSQVSRYSSLRVSWSSRFPQTPCL